MGSFKAFEWVALVGVLAACDQNFDLTPYATPPSPPPPPLFVPPPPPPPTPPPGIIVDDPVYNIKTFRPALAVRATECLMCHATVTSNVLTDFGLGSPHFFQQAYGNSEGFRLGWNDAGNPATVIGKVVVPEHVLTATEKTVGQFSDLTDWATLKNNASLSLKDILFAAWNLTDAKHASIASSIFDSPGVAASEPVLTRKTLTIRAPQLGSIVNLVTDAAKRAAYTSDPDHNPTMEVLNAAVLNQPNGTGLVQDDADAVLAAPNTKIFRNSGAVYCAGDIVILGTLYLKDLNLVTNSAGCRLYVSEGVFIEGPVNSNQADNRHNLQIASSLVISMNLGVRRLGASLTAYADLNLATDPDGLRIKTSNGEDSTMSWNPYTHIGSIDRVRSYYPGDLNEGSRAFNAIAYSARKVGSRLRDANDVSGTLPAGYAVVEKYGGGPQRLAIAYKGMLLNAPDIQRGDMGGFTGVLIGDHLNFPISHFQFSYDALFDDVNTILPRIPAPLTISVD